MNKKLDDYLKSTIDLIKDGLGEYVNEKAVDSFNPCINLFKHNYNNMTFSSSIGSDINQASSNVSSLVKWSNGLYCKIPKLAEVVEFHDEGIESFSKENFLKLFESSNLS